MTARGLAKVVLGGISTALCVAAFFWAAGRVGWIEGWAFLGLMVVGHSLSGLYVWRRDPELIRRRGRPGEGTPRWDMAWLAGFAILYLAVIFVAALDGGRYRWSAMPLWLWPVGAALYAFFLVFITWAMAVNTYFEKTVRIQTDRQHKVVDQGPYRFVRHPGYLGAIVGFVLAPPLLLGSWWAFLPAVLAAAWFVVRTALEDRFLQRELKGYADYARRVRYRLLPRVW
ncbi:MAG: methyltransferase family protein [Planctomycetota bacterium]